MSVELLQKLNKTTVPLREKAYNHRQNRWENMKIVKNFDVFFA